MSAVTHIAIDCPLCGEPFRENAKLVRDGALVRCPDCDRDIAIDGSDSLSADLLMRAREARRRRKQYLKTVRAMWRPPDERQPPVDLANIMRTLDALLARLDSGSAETGCSSTQLPAGL